MCTLTSQFWQRWYEAWHWWLCQQILIIWVISLQLRASLDYTPLPYAWGKSHTSCFKGYGKNGNINGASQWDENVPAIHSRTESTVANVKCELFTIIASQLLYLSGKQCRSGLQIFFHLPLYMFKLFKVRQVLMFMFLLFLHWKKLF